MNVLCLIFFTPLFAFGHRVYSQNIVFVKWLDLYFPPLRYGYFSHLKLGRLIYFFFISFSFILDFIFLSIKNYVLKIKTKQKVILRNVIFPYTVDCLNYPIYSILCLLITNLVFVSCSHPVFFFTQIIKHMNILLYF